MQRYAGKIKKEALALRQQGFTYSEIKKILHVQFPKGTLSGWFHNLPLTPEAQNILRYKSSHHLPEAREKWVLTRRAYKEEELQAVRRQYQHLVSRFDDNDVAMITLVTWYLAEGAKYPRKSLTFGNSDAGIIRLFLLLLRQCFLLDEQKLRCTLQCRADQNISDLEKFWSDVTQIPSSQFYKARVDPRTVGRKTMKTEYKGVCRIDYFSSKVLTVLLQVGKLLIGGR